MGGTCNFFWHLMRLAKRPTAKQNIHFSQSKKRRFKSKLNHYHQAKSGPSKEGSRMCCSSKPCVACARIHDQALAVRPFCDLHLSARLRDDWCFGYGSKWRSYYRHGIGTLRPPFFWVVITRGRAPQAAGFQRRLRYAGTFQSDSRGC